MMLLALIAHSVISCGWMDELNDTSTWKPLAVENKAEVFARHEGLLNMRLPHVPSGWPYEYQWSGVIREAIVDLDKYPVLVARVVGVNKGSYAHMDVEELDVNGKQSWGARTTTLLQPGLSTYDVGKELHGVRRLHLRLIIGGQNDGAGVGYSYVRFIQRSDLAFLQRHPDWHRVSWDR